MKIWMQWLGTGILMISSIAWADPSRPGGGEVTSAEAWTFKFTPSLYRTSHETTASDINLRANLGEHAFWLGYYRRGSEFQQARTGYEYTLQLPHWQIVPSLQLATRGFVGGSLNAQVGDEVYALLGYGRTNAHDYYNLNFDPNDSVVYGLGTRLLPRANIMLFTVKDNRLHTDQVVNHLVWRFNPDDHQRWTLDLSTKHGRPSEAEPSVSGKALSLTYDDRDIFVRLARDWKVNFSDDIQTRVSLGLRF